VKIKEHSSAFDVYRKTKIVAEIRLYLDEMKTETAE
jgi:hypothetical protein